MTSINSYSDNSKKTTFIETMKIKLMNGNLLCSSEQLQARKDIQFSFSNEIDDKYIKNLEKELGELYDKIEDGKITPDEDVQFNNSTDFIKGNNDINKIIKQVSTKENVLEFTMKYLNNMISKITPRE